MAKIKLAVPNDVLTQYQVGLAQKNLSAGLLPAVRRNFPNWRKKKKIRGGEIILQEADYTVPIDGMYPGIHLTVSLVSHMPGRNYAGLAEDLVRLLKETRDEKGKRFMTHVNIFVQMTLDTPVTFTLRKGVFVYRASFRGKILLEFKSVEWGRTWRFAVA